MKSYSRPTSHFLRHQVLTTGAAAALATSAFGATLAQQAYLKAAQRCGNNQFFGESVAAGRDTLVIGCPHDSNGGSGVNPNPNDCSIYESGAAYVFVRSGETWVQQAYLKASNNRRGDNYGWFFGGAVAISGDTIVVGATEEASHATGVNGDQSNGFAPYSGAAYVFVRRGTNWTQQAYLKASNTEAWDRFAIAVAIAGDTVVIGAGNEDSNATGIDGNQNDNSATNSGAAYVFVRRGTNWTQQAYLKASNTDPEDDFGWAVALWGDTLVITADLEQSTATGVNGDQTDNSADSAGATYIFTGLGIGPQLAIAADGVGGYLIRSTGTRDTTYLLQRAPAVTGPWDTIATLITPASGFIEYTETNAPPGQAFYRTTTP